MSKPTKNFAAAFAPLALAAVCLAGCGGGFGEVSQDAYQVAQALYGCCLAKSERHLDAVEAMLESDGSGDQPLQISAEERKWLDAMIATARDGRWESAAKSARRMMENQVQH
jgi:hypothetical protein